MTIGFDAISDNKEYITEMHKSMYDKLFFASRVNVNAILDFGCADGALIRAHEQLFPSVRMVGYDLNPDMLQAANEAKEENPDSQAIFTASWDKAVHKVVKQSPVSAILLSSVLHEVYSYCEGEEFNEFWRRLWNSGFDYVIIRDMVATNALYRDSEPEDVMAVRQRINDHRLWQWENEWGPITRQNSLHHLLLTHRYIANWEREYKENYLAVQSETFQKRVPSTYVPMYVEHYTLPFIKEQVYRYFGIHMTDVTHMKMILKRVP